MRLAELLRLYQPKTLERMFRERGISLPADRTRENLASGLSEILLAPGALDEILNSLSPLERAILYILLFYGETPAIDEQEWRSFVPRLARDLAAQRGSRPFRNLQVKGLLYRFVHPFVSSSDTYVLPREILHELSNVLVRRAVERCGVRLRRGGDGPPAGEDWLLRDLLALLLMAAPEGIPYTRGGTPYRRFIRRLEDLLPVPDMAEEILCDPFWLSDGYPSMQMEALFTFAEVCGLLREERDRYRVAPDAFRMVGGSVGNRFAEWMDLRISYSDPSGLFRQFLAALLRGLPDDTGLDPGMFLGWSDPFPGEERFSFGPDLAEEAASHLWKMVYAGLLEVTRAEQGRPLLVLTRLGTALLSDDDVESAREERLFVVQPNFEVLADPCSLAAAGEEISPFVELVTADRTFSLRFSRESVRRGIHHGHSIPSCCQALCRHATHEVPENVLDTIQEWAAEYHRVRLRPGLLIQVDTDEQAEMLRHSPVFKLIREEISPRSFWAAMEDRTEIKRRLTGLKMDVDDEPPRVREDDEDLTEIRPVQGLSRLRTREATPECYPVGSFEPAEEVLREILQSYEIVPPGGGAGGPGGGDRSPGSGEPHKIRAAVSEALRTERPLRLTLFQRGGRPPETQIVSPICWGPDRGRFSFYAHQSGGAERLWRLDEILDASLLPEDTPFDM